MKKTVLSTMGAVVIMAFAMVSCGGSSVPKASLKNQVDSLSYSYGVTMADQGLGQYLEQLGVLQSTSSIEYDYQMKIASADSLEKESLRKELAAKIDSVNRINAPKMNQFIKGLKEGINLDEASAYAQGLSVGIQFSQQMLPQLNGMVFSEDSTKKANVNQILSGLISTLKNEQLAINKMDASAYIQDEFNKAQERQMKAQEETLKEQYSEDIAAGDAFMKENSQREEVVTLPSGLQYEVIKEGKGAVPTDTDRVKVHYHGTLIDGTVFDSSIDRGTPQSFGVNQVIPGWTEALKLMPVGSKWRIYVPYNLAYGSADRGTIKPFSNLIFDVELLEIEK